MKTKYMISKVLKVFALVTMALSLANCSKSDSGGTAAVTSAYSYNVSGQCVLTASGAVVSTTYCATTNNGYSYNSAGQCIQTSNGTVVSTSLCTQSGTNGYTYNANGQCIQTSTGIVVQQTLCQNTSGYTQVCTGPHFDSVRWWNCGVEVNCSGYRLQNQSGQVVQCQ